MLSLIGDVGLPEVLVIVAVAVIIFGNRLPEIAARAYGQFHKARESLERLRHESGIDREWREIRRNVQDAARRASVHEALLPPAESTRAREAKARTVESEPKPAEDAPSDSAGGAAGGAQEDADSGEAEHGAERDTKAAGDPDEGRAPRSMDRAAAAAPDLASEETDDLADRRESS